MFAVAGIASRARTCSGFADRDPHVCECLGLRWGALLQNVSTWTKFTAMAAFVILGFAIGKGNWSNFHAHARSA